MAFDGNGTFNRVYNWTADAANAIDITASRVDTEDTGFAAGLTLCVTRDGQGKMAADWLPSVDNTYNLGTISFRWASLTIGGPIVSGAITSSGTILGNAVSATTALTLQTMNCRANTSAVKASATNRTNNTLANDPDLGIVLPSAGTYAFQLFLICPSGAGGFAATMVCTNVTSGGWYMQGTLSGSVVAGVTVLALNGGGVASGGNGANNCVSITGTVIVSAAAALTLQWAQSSTNAANTSVNAGSFMTVTKLA